MAGLQSQNISVASARGPAAAGGRQSDRSTCIFCKSKSTPSAADPHAPVFAFFSLADCRHYACQPCALVHCDATGRHIYCPSCQCTSRLSQSGKRRTGSKAGRREQEKERVGIDDGVSSVASRRSKGHTPRSALRKDNAERRAHSSVQFAKEPEEGRSTSPLTRETVAQVPSDPALARKRAQEDEELSQATKASEPGMGLFSLTAPKPRRLRKRSESKERDGSKERRGSKERKKSPRTQSAPAPKLPPSLLPPRQGFVAPPPLVLHTVEEDEAEKKAEEAAQQEQQQPLPEEGEEDINIDVSVSARRKDDLIEDPETNNEGPTASVTRRRSSLSDELTRELLQDCIDSEVTEREGIERSHAHYLQQLQQLQEEAVSRARIYRPLENEFEVSPGTPMSRPSLLDVSVEPVSATSDEDSSRRGSTRKATPMDRKRTSSANRRSRDKSAEHRQNQSTQNNSEIGDDTGNNTGVISAPTTEKKTPPSTHSDNDEKKGEEVDTAAQDNDNNNNNETPAAKVDSNEDENKKEKKGEEEELEISPMDSEKTNSTKVSSISDKDKKRKRKEPKAQEGEDNKEKHDDGEERQKGSRRSSADKRKDEEATKATDKEEENKKVDENAVDSQLEGKTNERDTTAAGEQPPADTEGLDTRDTEEDDKNNKENIEEAAAPEGVTADDGVKPDDDGAVAQETAEGNDKTKNDNEAVPEVTVGDDENKHDEAAPASQVGADDNSNKQDDNETAPKVPAGEENNDGAPVSGAEADDNNKNAGDGEATAPEGTAGGNTVKPGDEGKETTTAPEANHKNTEEPTDAQPNAEVPTADGSKQSEDAVPVEDTHQGQDALFAPEKATTPLPVTSHHTKVFEGDDWGALLVHQPAALKEAFLLDITCACDLRRSQIQSTTFALGSLIASFTVDHDDHTMTSGEMEAVLLTYDFPHVMALYKRQKEEEERSTLLLDVTEPVPEDPSIAERLEQQRSALSLSMEATAEDLALAQQLKDRAKELRVKELQRQLRNVELDEEVEREAIEGMEAVVRTQWDHTKRAVGQHQLQQSLLEEELEGAAEDAKLKARLLQQRRAQLQLDEEQARALQENEELSARTNIIVRERMGRVAAAAEEADRLQEERNCLRQQREAVRLLQELVLEEPQRRQRLRRQEAHAREVIGLEADSDKATLLLLENDAARRAASVAAEQGRQARWRQGLLQLEDLLSEEEEGRFTLKEAERDGRRALRALHTHQLFNQSLQEQTLLTEVTALEGRQASPSLRPPVDESQIPRQASPSHLSSYSYWHEDPEVVRRMREREMAKEEEIVEARARLREAERRLEEETAVRERAERERQRAVEDAQQLLQDAERRATERLGEACRLVEEQYAARLEQRDGLLQLREEEKQALMAQKKLALEEAQQHFNEAIQLAKLEASEARQQAEHVLQTASERRRLWLEEEAKQEEHFIQVREGSQRRVEELLLRREEELQQLLARQTPLHLLLEQQRQQQEEYLRQLTPQIVHVPPPVREESTLQEGPVGTTTVLAAPTAATFPLTKEEFQDYTQAIVLTAVREAVREVLDARQEGERLRTEGNHLYEHSEERLRRRRAHRDRAAEDLSTMETSSVSQASSHEVQQQHHNNNSSVGTQTQFAAHPPPSSPKDRRGSDTPNPRHANNNNNNNVDEENLPSPVAALNSSQRFFDESFAEREFHTSQHKTDNSPLTRHLPYPNNYNYYGNKNVRQNYYYVLRRQSKALYEEEQQHMHFDHNNNINSEKGAGHVYVGPMRIEISPPHRSQTREDDNNNNNRYPIDPNEIRETSNSLHSYNDDNNNNENTMEVSTSSALPQPSLICKTCYRSDITSPCWSCSTLVCRKCGVNNPKNKNVNLCCKAHHRAMVRQYHLNHKKQRQEEEMDMDDNSYENIKQQHHMNSPLPRRRSSQQSLPSQELHPSRPVRRQLIKEEINNNADAYYYNDTYINPAEYTNIHETNQHQNNNNNNKQTSFQDNNVSYPSTVNSISHPPYGDDSTVLQNNNNNNNNQNSNVNPSRRVSVQEDPQNISGGSRRNISNNNENSLSQTRRQKPVNNTATQTSLPSFSGSYSSFSIMEEPKTEKKKFDAFFVPFGNEGDNNNNEEEGGGGAPRRKKPPTPVNYVRIEKIYPDKKQQRTTSRSKSADKRKNNNNNRNQNNKSAARRHPSTEEAARAYHYPTVARPTAASRGRSLGDETKGVYETTPRRSKASASPKNTKKQQALKDELAYNRPYIDAHGVIQTPPKRRTISKNNNTQNNNNKRYTSTSPKPTSTNNNNNNINHRETAQRRSPQRVSPPQKVSHNNNNNNNNTNYSTASPPSTVSTASNNNNQNYNNNNIAELLPPDLRDRYNKMIHRYTAENNHHHHNNVHRRGPFDLDTSVHHNTKKAKKSNHNNYNNNNNNNEAPTLDELDKRLRQLKMSDKREIKKEKERNLKTNAPASYKDNNNNNIHSNKYYKPVPPFATERNVSEEGAFYNSPYTASRYQYY